MQFSRSRTSMRRKVPALLGTTICSGFAFEPSTCSTPTMPALRAVDSVRFRPFGRQSRIITQIDDDLPGFGINVYRDRKRDPVRRTGKGIEARPASDAPCRERRDLRRHHAFGIIEPLGDKAFHRVRAKGGAELLQPPLGEPYGTENRKVVTVPDIEATDATLRHPNDVADLAVVLLYAHTRKNQGAFLIGRPAPWACTSSAKHFRNRPCALS